MQHIYTETEARQWAEEEAKGIQRGFDACKEVPAFVRNGSPALKEHFGNMWRAGCWMNAMLAAQGATAEEAHNIGFAHGQQCAFRPPEAAWTYAVAYLNEFVANRKVKDQPGVELADKIIKETIKIT